MLKITPIEYLGNADFDRHYRAFAIAENFATHLNNSISLTAYVDRLIEEFKAGDDCNLGSANRAVLFTAMGLVIDFVQDNRGNNAISAGFHCFREASRVLEAFSNQPLLGGDRAGVDFVSSLFEFGNLLYESIDSSNQSIIGADFIEGIAHISHAFQFKGAFAAVDRTSEDYLVLEELRSELSYFVEAIVLRCVHDSESYKNHEHQVVGLRILNGVIDASESARLLDLEEPFEELIVRIERAIYTYEAIENGTDFENELGNVYRSLLHWVRSVGLEHDSLSGLLSASLLHHTTLWSGWMPTLSTLVTLSPNNQNLVRDSLMTMVILPMLEGEEDLILPLIEFMRDGRGQLDAVADVLRSLGKDNSQDVFRILSPHLRNDSLIDHLRDLATAPLEAL